LEMTEHQSKRAIWLGLAAALTAGAFSFSAVQASAAQAVKGFEPVPVQGVGVPGFQPVEGTSSSPRADAGPSDKSGAKALEQQADGTWQKRS
jgi:hypothetical protein